VSVVLAEASVKVTTDVSKVGADAEAGIRKQASTFSKMGDVAGGILSASLVQSGVNAITRIFSAGMEEAKTGALITSQFQAGLISTNNVANLSVASMNTLADSVAGYTGQSRASIGQTEQVLQTFTNLRNVGADKIFDQATVAAANLAAKMGGDASASAVQLGIALNDPEKGLSRLQRIGVTFTAQQKESIKTMEAHGNILGAQKVILAELNTEFGGAAVAAGQTWPGAINRFRVATSNMSGTLISAFGPTLLRIFNAVDDVLAKLQPHAEKLGEAINKHLGKLDLGKLIKPFLELFTALSPLHLIFEALAPNLSIIRTLVGQLAGVLGGVLKAALPIVADLLGVLSKVIIAILPDVMSLVKILGDAFLDAVKQLIPFIKPLVKIIADLALAIVPLIPAVLKVVEAFLPLVMVLVKVIDGAILPALIKLLLALLPPIVKVIEPLVKLLVPVLTVLADVIGVVVDWLATAIDWLVKAGQGFTDLYEKAIQPVANFIMSAFNLLGFGARVLYTTFIKPAFDGIGEVFGWLWDTIIQPISNLIGGAVMVIGDVFASVFGGIGDVVSGAFNGVVDIIRGVMNLIGGAVNTAIDGINSLIKAVDTVPGVNFPMLPKMPHFANGVQGFGGGLAMVGERGPEIVNLPPGSDVYSTGTGPKAGNHYHFEAGAIVLDASRMRKISDVVDMIDGITQTARSGRAA
jgi:phage-related protein